MRRAVATSASAPSNRPRPTRRELREIASRMGCEIVRSIGTRDQRRQRRDKRPAFDKLCRDAARRSTWYGVVSRPVRPQPAGFSRFLSKLPQDRLFPNRGLDTTTPAGRHVSDDGRVCRVQARHGPGRVRWACEGEERGEASWSASDSLCVGETIRRLWRSGRPGIRVADGSASIHRQCSASAPDGSVAVAYARRK
jgi:hypothetical protein